MCLVSSLGEWLLREIPNQKTKKHQNHGAQPKLNINTSGFTPATGTRSLTNWNQFSCVPFVPPWTFRVSIGQPSKSWVGREKASQRYLTPNPYRTTHSHFSSRKVSFWGKSPSPADADTSQKLLEQYLLLFVSLDLSWTSCHRTPTRCSSLPWGLRSRLYRDLHLPAFLTFLGSCLRTAQDFPLWSSKSSKWQDTTTLSSDHSETVPFFSFSFLFPCNSTSTWLPLSIAVTAHPTCQSLSLFCSWLRGRWQTPCRSQAVNLIPENILTIHWCSPVTETSPRSCNRSTHSLENIWMWSKYVVFPPQV